MQFAMRNLTSFPMEKLCYDLKLEVVEQMKPNDAIELIKMNAGFRSMLRRIPWIVFGQHVYGVTCVSRRIDLIKFRFHSFVEPEDVDLPLSLTQRIHSCDRLFVHGNYRHFSVKHLTILNQLTSVKDLNLMLDSDQFLRKFLENFSVIGREHTWIKLETDSFLEDQVITELFKNFIMNQLSDCKRVSYSYYSAAAFHFYYDAVAKTSIKFLKMDVSSFEDVDVEEARLLIVKSMVEKGIPSKNLTAAVHMSTSPLGCPSPKHRFFDFILQYRGLKEFDRKIYPEIIEMANELSEKYYKLSLDFTCARFFRRNIDSSKGCVYMFLRNQFWAFYVQPQFEIMEF